MAKPNHTPREPLRSKLEVALACCTQGTRTLATLQAHLTEDTTHQVLGTLAAIAKGTITEHELPQKGYTPRARKGTSRPSGVSKDRSNAVG